MWWLEMMMLLLTFCLMGCYFELGIGVLGSMKAGCILEAEAIDNGGGCMTAVGDVMTAEFGDLF